MVQYPILKFKPDQIRIQLSHDRYRTGTYFLRKVNIFFDQLTIAQYLEKNFVAGIVKIIKIKPKYKLESDPDPAGRSPNPGPGRSYLSRQTRIHNLRANVTNSQGCTYFSFYLDQL